MKHNCTNCQYRHYGACDIGTFDWNEGCPQFVEGKCFSCVACYDEDIDRYCIDYNWPGGCINYKPFKAWHDPNTEQKPRAGVWKDDHKELRRNRRKMKERKKLERIQKSKFLGYLYPYYLDLVKISDEIFKERLRKIDWKHSKSQARKRTNRKIRNARIDRYVSRQHGAYRKAFDYKWDLW